MNIRSQKRSTAVPAKRGGKTGKDAKSVAGSLLSKRFATGLSKRLMGVSKPGKAAAELTIYDANGRVTATTRFATDPFEPDARARAILRGREIALKDLEQAGGAYSLEEVRTVLHGVTRQRVEQLVSDGRLLAVPGPSNRRRYPTLQFNKAGELVEGLKEVQAALQTSNPWAVLNYLAHPDPRLQGRPPIEVLWDGEITEVVGAASRAFEPGG